VYQHGTHRRISPMSPLFLFFGSGTRTTREAMHDPGPVVYNDSTTVPFASRSNSSTTGSTVKELNDDPAPSGGISRNRSRSGTGGNVANSETDQGAGRPGEQERR